MHTVVASCSRACIIINSRQHSTAHSLLYITPLPPPLSPPHLLASPMYVYHVGTRALFLCSLSLSFSLLFSFKSGVISAYLTCRLHQVQSLPSSSLLRFFFFTPLPCLGISLIASCETKLVSLSFLLSRLLQIDESIDSTRGVVVLGTKKKKGSWNEYSQPEGEEEKGSRNRNGQ